MMEKELLSIIQKKADKSAAIIHRVLSVSGSLEPKNIQIMFDAIPCEVNDDGSVLILTGTKDKPYGVGLQDPPEMVLLYNKKGGLLLPTSSIRDVIKKYRDELTPEIDSTYSIMGVRLSAGIISSWIGEDFLTALHQSSVHDS